LGPKAGLLDLVSFPKAAGAVYRRDWRPSHAQETVS